MPAPLISWVCPSGGALVLTRVDVGHDDAFVREVARYAGVPIPRVEGTLDAAPPAGFILWNARALDVGDALMAGSAELAGELARRVGARLVQFNVSPSRILPRLERLPMAAVIDGASQRSWANADSVRPGRQGFYGRRDVAALIGATVDEREQSERFCFMSGRSAGGLPHLLADYLTALGRTEA